MGIGAEISVGLQLKLAFSRLSAHQAEQRPEKVAHIPGEVAGCYASNAARHGTGSGGALAAYKLQWIFV